MVQDPGIVVLCSEDTGGLSPRRNAATSFFAFWLSHVPASESARFWSVIRRALAADGRVLFVDDLPSAADRETYAAGSSEVVERHLADGTRHQLVKLVRDCGELRRHLAGLGWQADIGQTGPDWMLGEARLAE